MVRPYFSAANALANAPVFGSVRAISAARVLGQWGERTDGPQFFPRPTGASPSPRDGGGRGGAFFPGPARPTPPRKNPPAANPPPPPVFFPPPPAAPRLPGGRARKSPRPP